MCLPSQQTRQTNGGDDIAKTQTQNVSFSDPWRRVSTTEQDNEWGRGMIERSICSHGLWRKTSSAASLTSHKCLAAGVEHSEIKTVRTGVTCVTLPEAAECKALLCTYLCFHTVFLKQCHYSAVLIAETSESHSVSCFVSPVCVCALCDCPTPPPPPQCLAYLYSSGIWLLWQWLRLILLSAG